MSDMYMNQKNLTRGDHWKTCGYLVAVSAVRCEGTL